MKIYTFYSRPGDVPPEEAIAVPERFSIWAFLFGFLWALYRRLWLVAIVIAGVQVAVPFLVERFALDPALGSVALLAFGIFVGCSANDWRREKLERNGYEMVGIAVGRDLEEAERRFFDRVLVREEPPRPPIPPAPPSPAARLFGADRA